MQLYLCAHVEVWFAFFKLRRCNDLCTTAQIDCEAINEGGQRTATEYHLSELLDQLSRVIEQTPADVDSHSNSGITTRISFVYAQRVKQR